MSGVLLSFIPKNCDKIGDYVQKSTKNRIILDEMIKLG